MASISPTALFTGLTYDSQSGEVRIPLSSLPGLTSSEVNPTTGDGREVARIILNTIADKINALAAADKPTKMSVTTPSLTALNATQVSKSYTFSFTIDLPITELQMPAE